MVIGMTTKVCSRCGVECFIDDFHRAGKQGRRSECYRCTNSDVGRKLFNRARQRAMRALKANHPTEYKELLAQELAKLAELSASPEAEQQSQEGNTRTT